MNRNILCAASVLAGLSAVALAATGAWANDDEELPFDEAFIFFELNNTDGDLGIHAKVDGGPWKSLKIVRDDNDRKLLDIKLRSRLRKQGLTELFFESAEPPFDELDPEVFFARFPEGIYEVEGRSLEGEELESEAEVTHLMPAPPEPMVNSELAAEDCDADPLPSVDGSEAVTLTWPAVTMSHPDLGRTNEPITVVNYEVVAEIDETPWKVSAILPPAATSFVVPTEIIDLALEGEGEVKFEILVREESYNQTAVESCFEVE